MRIIKYITALTNCKYLCQSHAILRFSEFYLFSRKILDNSTFRINQIFDLILPHGLTEIECLSTDHAHLFFKLLLTKILIQWKNLAQLIDQFFDKTKIGDLNMFLLIKNLF